MTTNYALEVKKLGDIYYIGFKDQEPELLDLLYYGGKGAAAVVTLLNSFKEGRELLEKALKGMDERCQES